jgi:hypothetical protein
VPILAGSALEDASVVLSDGDLTMNLRTETIRCTEIDFGWPDVRTVADDRTDADGTQDTTERHGARAVTLTLKLIGETRLQDLDALRAFCHPRQRPVLTVGTSGWVEPRRVQLRPGPQTAPLRGQDGAHIPVQVGWIAPDGLLEAVTASELTVAPSGNAKTGISYPVSYPVSYEVSTSGGPVTVTNAGNTSVSPVVRMYGPCSGPVISVDGGGALSFPTLTINAGDYVEVDFRERTVLADGRASLSRLGTLDFASASWWRLLPGDNLVRYSPASYSGAAAAVVMWRDSWL